MNELPSEAARRDLSRFRHENATTPMVFTTRDFGVGGDLDIGKKLEMLPLTESQMREFVNKYLPEGGEQMLRQLGKRLREFGQTPLPLMMLCSLFSATGVVPSNLGLVFRQFTQKLKQDAPVMDESRRWWQPLLQHLAFKMTQGHKQTELQLAIPRQEAEEIMTAFLRDEQFDKPRDRAISRLEDLLKHHLIQLGVGNQIEFQHPLIQEYYTAESLLEKLPHLSDEELKRQYLNYLKWTEPLALMLELVNEQQQALRVVNLAIDVDLQLGARLAGATKPEFQVATVGLITQMEIPLPIKMRLLAKTRSDLALGTLLQALKHQEPRICKRAAEALAAIGTETAVAALVQVLKHQNPDVSRRGAEALAAIGSEAAVGALVQAMKHPDSDLRRSVAYAIANIGTEASVTALVQALNDTDYVVRGIAAEALGNIGTEAATETLLPALKHQDYIVRRSVATALGKIGNATAVDAIVQALNDEDSDLRVSVVATLGKIGNTAAVNALLQALNDEDYMVRWSAAEALGKIGNPAAVEALLPALNDEDSDVRNSAADALANIGNAAAVDALVQGLKDQEYYVRWSAADALTNINKDTAVEPLLDALSDDDSYVRSIAAESLGNIGNDGATAALLYALNDEDYVVRWSAAEALGKIGDQAAVSSLILALNDEDDYVRSSAAEALGKIPNPAAVQSLLLVLKDENANVRSKAAEALGKIPNPAAVQSLLFSLKDEDVDVRKSATYALGRIGDASAVESLLSSLKNEDVEVRRNATYALGKIGNGAAAKALLYALNDPNYHIRITVVAALGEIGNAEAVQALFYALRDESVEVRKSVAYALGKIDNAAAIEVLSYALEDENFDVRRSAAYALEKLSSSEILPRLNEFLLTTEEIYWLDTIAAIQERCNFYNHTLTLTPIDLTVEESASMPTVQTISVPKSFILHLSDLHFGTLAEANNWYGTLADDLNDLSSELDFNQIDALILSGDIANRSTEEEYHAAEKFITQLAGEFRIKRSNIIIVPGNHDLNWDLGDKAYEKCRENGRLVLKCNHEVHQRRFDHFRNFYQAIRMESYPLEYEHQGIVYHMPRLKILVLGLNSSWQLDSNETKEASIHPDAITFALNKIRDNQDFYEGFLKMAVWHHPLSSPFEDRIKDSGFMERLAKGGFRFALHGHVHKSDKSLYSYDVSAGGRKLNIIGAGTFGAPVREWTPGFPLQYNLMKVEDNKMTVYTRRREELNGAWKPDARWEGIAPYPLPYYEMTI
ncbi:HEAT repeat domain-containing protein [Microseira sp. BLCC-F43]|uniref:HEAT repeat domain-containing protein n=1 Tax=Microseira sp. BLCC-F43 TaxID=3153602 RepID=UPI0035B797A0